MTERRMPWEHPGYADITAAGINSGELEVTFANGDVVRLSLKPLGIKPIFVRVDDGLSVRLGDGDKEVAISWSEIRTRTDAAYADHLSDLTRNEAWRIGRRIRALREDRNVTPEQLATNAGISAAQLLRIEKGLEDGLRLSTVRTLLRELGATFTDVAGPTALEVPVRTIITRAIKAGVPRELASALAKAVPRLTAPDLLANAFGWSRDALLVDVPTMPALPVAVQFKTSAAQQPSSSPLVHLALSVARIARTAFDVPRFRPISNNPVLIRGQAIGPTGDVSLASLLEWTWSRGIAVLPLSGKGGFAAAVIGLDGLPTIVIKETRDLAVFWLFDVAHELGHIALGHVRTALVDVNSPTNPNRSDLEEQAATEFALELLLPNYVELLTSVRAEARGSGIEFKFAVQRVAARARVSAGVLGIVAAFALTEVGRPLDRWGSATNLAKPEGSGREVTSAAAERRAVLNKLSQLDAALIRTAVLTKAGE